MGPALALASSQAQVPAPFGRGSLEGRPVIFGLPIQTNDFADLDVRDAQNQPVSAPAARQELTQLFVRNLVELTVFAAPHSMTAAMAAAEAFLALFNKLIFEPLSKPLAAIFDALGPSQRRFVHNVHNLWITVSVGVLLAFLTKTLFCPHRTDLILPLRC